MKRKPETENTWEQDIEALIAKHGFRSFSCSCILPDGNYFGGIIGKQSPGSFFEAVYAIARLWQYARERTRDKLNSIGDCG